MELLAIDCIFDLTAGQPYYTQCLASTSFDHCMSSSFPEVTKEIVENQLKKSIKEYSGGLNWFWDGFEPAEKVIFYIMALIVEDGTSIDFSSIEAKARDLKFFPILQEINSTLKKLKDLKIILGGDDNTYLFRVEFLRRWILWEHTIDEVKTSLDDINEDVKLAFKKGRLNQQRDNLNVAIECFEEVLALNPEHYDAQYALARCYQSLAKDDFNYFGKAVDAYGKAHKLDCLSGKYGYLNILKIKLRHPKFEDYDQEDVLKEIHKINPDDHEITRRLVEVMIVKNKDISKIDDLESIDKLDLSNKQLKEFPSQIKLLTNLKRLDLSNNSMRYVLPDIIAKTEKLKDLNLYGNQNLIGVPVDVIKGSFDEIITYIFSDEYKRILGKRSIIDISVREDQKSTKSIHKRRGKKTKGTWRQRYQIMKLDRVVRYFFVIEKTDGVYHVSTYNYKTLPLKNAYSLKLAPNDKVRIKDKSYMLGKLVEALIQSRTEDLEIAYDERGQLELGQYLYNELFNNGNSKIARDLRDEKQKIEIRIVTKDEHIVRLPWVLLADGEGNYLSSLGCSVSLGGNLKCRNWELPPSPRILVAMPQPLGAPKTRAESHLEKLEDMLSAVDRRHYRGRNFNVVTTWEDFQEQVRNFRPHIFYYYGHGVGNTNKSSLVFAFGKSRKRKDIPVSYVADCLRIWPERPPMIAYLNCCQGDAGGLLGVGMKLRSFIPVVVTNLSIAKLEAAQALGMAFWRSVILDGLPPHEAVNEMRHGLGKLKLSFGDARWMTPVIHCGYDEWKANPPERINRLDHDPYWHLKLSRVTQFGMVCYLTAQMLREHKPRSLACVWYGAEGQGVDLFHHRLKVELPEKLIDTIVYEIQPDWPMELKNPHQSFEEMLTEAFDVSDFAQIPARIRTWSRNRAGTQTLVYVRHQPLRSTKVITLNRLKTYLEWWDETFIPMLPELAFALLGMSFVVENPERFYKILVDKKRIADLPLRDTMFHLLDEMEGLAKKDLLDFLKAQNIHLPRKHKDRVLEEILEETGGRYEMTLEALKDIVNRGWDLSGDDVEVDTGEEVEEEFGVDDVEA